MTDAPKCPKCGEPAVETSFGVSCSHRPESCTRIAELERQLEEAQSSVLALRDFLGKLVEEDYCSDQCTYRQCSCGWQGVHKEVQALLSTTSALAAQRKREIQREAVEAVIKGVLANFVYGCKDSELPAMIRAGAEKGAAILSTLEAPDAPHS